MILVYDPANSRVIDIETGHTFSYNEKDRELVCDFDTSTPMLGDDTAAGLWDWLVKASLQFKSKEAK